MTQASSWFIRRMEKGVAKREKKITKLNDKMAGYEARHNDGKISRAKLEQRKQEIEARIRVLNAKIHTYRGKIGQERRKIDKGE